MVPAIVRSFAYFPAATSAMAWERDKCCQHLRVAWQTYERVFHVNERRDEDGKMREMYVRCT